MTSSENAASREACEAPLSTSGAGALRVVLLGRTGTGRSSSGNTILGRPAFAADASPCSVTSHCTRQTGTVGGRSVCVVDTPGLFHTQLAQQEVMAEVGRCVELCAPGPHAFLLTLQPGRFTPEERDALQWIKAVFGPGAARFTLVLFTWGDQLQGKGIDAFLQESKELSELVSSSQGGYHILDNRNQEPGQVTELLQKVEKIVVDSGGGCYSNEMFKEAERAINEAQEKILKEAGHELESPHRSQDKEGSSERRRREEEEEEEEARRRMERLFWCELATALGKGAAEGAGIVGKDKGKGKVVKKAAALAATPLSISSAAKVVGGAVREGGKVLYKHRKTFLR
ncbi:GTPase IMAP family member 4-like [Betta splendens]|uniref:GTPase IMAP family member 4-like n=1 Tax=Betta splendens TaxID=158456 RepID=A0A6P7N5J7_BETSP|nr:GTPase IMAP family member 4-like [Betta splendens]